MGCQYGRVGRPLQGQTSTEIRHDGEHHREGEAAGLEGVGSSGDKGMNNPKYNPDPNDDHPGKPIPPREHNSTLSGGENMVPEKAGGFSRSDKEERVRSREHDMRGTWNSPSGGGISAKNAKVC